MLHRAKAGKINACAHRDKLFPCSMIKQDFFDGLRDGIPIFLGYLSVSFSFGIIAVAAGLNIFEATAVSASNLTSAGQFAGIRIIQAAGSLWEMAAAQGVINMRYALMSVSLSQNYGEGTGTGARLGAAFFVTDEIFALASVRKPPLTASYMLGMGCIATLGWVSGTAVGAAAGDLLPSVVSNALGIALYAMFIAIVVPAAKRDVPVALVVFIAVGISCLFKFTPVLSGLSYGGVIIVAAVVASAIGALMFPLHTENNIGQNEKGEGC